MAYKKSIDDIEKELKEYYKDIHNIEVPQNLENILSINIKEIRPKRKYRVLLIASVILAFLAATLTFCPAIADTVLDLLKFKDSVSNSNDIGVKKVFELELGKEIYIENSNEDMTIALQRAYRDKNRIIILATVKFNDDDKIDKKILAFNGTLIDENGESTYESYIRKVEVDGDNKNYDEKINSALLEFQFNEIENLGQSLTLTIEEDRSLADNLAASLFEDKNEENVTEVKDNLDDKERFQNTEITDNNVKSADNPSQEDISTSSLDVDTDVIAKEVNADEIKSDLDTKESLQNTETTNNIENAGKSSQEAASTFDLGSLDIDTNALAIDINKEIDIAGTKVNFKKLEATPSEMRLYYEYDGFLTYKIIDKKEYEAMGFLVDDLIINGKKYSGSEGMAEEKNVEAEETIKYKVMGFATFRPLKSVDELNNIQDIILKLSFISKEIPTDISIPLEENAKASCFDKDGRKYDILVKSFEIKDNDLVIQCELNGEFNGFSIGDSSVLDGNNVHEITRNTPKTKKVDNKNKGHIIKEYQLTFPKPSKLTNLKLIIKSVEVMMYKNLDVKLK